MTQVDSVRVRCLRPFILRGASVPAGSQVDATPLEAAQVLESGRGELVTPSDFARVVEAAKAATRKALMQRGHIARGEHGMPVQ